RQQQQLLPLPRPHLPLHQPRRLLQGPVRQRDPVPQRDLAQRRRRARSVGSAVRALSPTRRLNLLVPTDICALGEGIVLWSSRSPSVACRQGFFENVLYICREDRKSVV